MKEMKDAIAEHRAAKSAAVKAWTEDLKNGDPGAKRGFARWCEQNDPSVKALEETMRTKTALFNACENSDGSAARLTIFQTRVQQAVIGAEKNPGSVPRRSTASIRPS